MEWTIPGTVLTASKAEAVYIPEQFRAMFMTNNIEPVPGAKARVKEVLRVMLTAWLAARMTREAERMLATLQTE